MRISDIFIVFAFLVSVLFFPVCSFGEEPASDLDDGISLDDPIEDYDELKKDVNISFIVRDAKNDSNYYKNFGHRRTGKDQPEVTGMGVVNVQPGAKVDSIINIFEGDNNTVIDEGN